MFVVITLRNEEAHAVSYRLNNGGYRTICGKTIANNHQMNTYASDDTFPGLCKNCKSYHDEMYKDDLEYDPRMARSEASTRYTDVVVYNKLDIVGARAKFEQSMERRWPKLIRYQRIPQKIRKK